MNTTSRILALSIIGLLTACSSAYVISTKDGTMITATSKPKLDPKTGMYTYRDTQGKEVSVRQDDVKQIIER